MHTALGRAAGNHVMGLVGTSARRCSVHSPLLRRTCSRNFQAGCFSHSWDKCSHRLPPTAFCKRTLLSSRSLGIRHMSWLHKLNLRRHNEPYNEPSDGLEEAAKVALLEKAMKGRQPTDLMLRCTVLDAEGNVKTISGQFRKADLCAEHRLNPRDLRKIDSRIPNLVPTILVRKEAILINILHIRALVKADAVILFDTYGSADSRLHSVFLYHLEHNLRAKGPGPPYEFRALESILLSVLSALEAEMVFIRNLVGGLLGELEDDIDHDRFKRLLHYSRRLAAFQNRAKLVQEAIEEVLEQDEDLAAMYLSDKKHGVQRHEDDHDELEVLMESFAKQVEEIVNEAENIQTNVQSTQEIVELILDSNRNALLALDLKVSIWTMGIGVGTLVAGLFGMNLKSHIEENEYAFGLMSVLTVVAAMAFSWQGLRRLARIRKVGLSNGKKAEKSWLPLSLRGRKYDASAVHLLMKFPPMYKMLGEILAAAGGVGRERLPRALEHNCSPATAHGVQCSFQTSISGRRGELGANFRYSLGHPTHRAVFQLDIQRRQSLPGTVFSGLDPTSTVQLPGSVFSGLDSITTSLTQLPGTILSTVSSTMTTTSTSSSSSTAPTPSLLFAGITQPLLTCETATVNWHTPPDVSETIASSLNAALQSYVWQPVNVTAGSYKLQAVGAGLSVISVPFTITNGSDTACLTASSPTSSVSQPFSSTSVSSGTLTSTSSSTSQSTTAFPVTAVSSHTHSGAIAGGVIGGVAVIVAVIAVMFYFGLCRRTPTRSRRSRISGPHRQLGKWGGLSSRDSGMEVGLPVSAVIAAHPKRGTTDSTGAMIPGSPMVSTTGHAVERGASRGASEEDLSTLAEEEKVNPARTMEYVETVPYSNRRLSLSGSTVNHDPGIARGSNGRSRTKSASQNRALALAKLDGSSSPIPSSPSPTPQANPFNLVYRRSVDSTHLRRVDSPIVGSPASTEMAPVNRASSGGRRAMRKPVPAYDAAETPVRSSSHASTSASTRSSPVARMYRIEGSETGSGSTVHGRVPPPRTPSREELQAAGLELPALTHKSSFGDARPMHYLIPDMPPLSTNRRAKMSIFLLCVYLCVLAWITYWLLLRWTDIVRNHASPHISEGGTLSPLPPYPIATSQFGAPA
ncbi:Mitochondrial inner membrane magnesium transporter LPE10 [Grifola frondosa]|uniref:Mitochondrial inner membrane magnesium transporter LPE10 n=1 Tax=Grifola frondosa TaxID=5627 RepID=A0A1C7MN96_GRIFR|nr:Mitochondrial inner membrane magnesium transporter LPE10 [Grifola frondosa]